MIDEFQDTYKEVLNSLSQQWLLTQLKHKVSATATNSFWSTTLQFLPQLLMYKEREGVQKDIPQFIQQRRKLYSGNCPDVHMEFGFKHKTTGEITTVTSSFAPLKAFQHNPNYIKLYETAYIKVKTTTAYMICYPTKFLI